MPWGFSVSTQLAIVTGGLGVMLALVAGRAFWFAGTVEVVLPSLSEPGNDVGLRAVLGDAADVVGLCLAAGVVTLVLIGPLAILIVRRLSFGLDEIADKLLRISRNETGVNIPFVDEPGELGDLARAIQIFTANARSLLDQQELIEQLNIRFDVALNHMACGLSMFGPDERLVVCNRHFRDMYNLSESQCRPGVMLRDLVILRASGGYVSDEKRERFIEKWHSHHRSIMVRGERANSVFQMDDGRTISIAYEPLPDGGCVAVHEDITHKRRHEDKIKRLAHEDSLTGVANRYCFREELKRLLDSCPRGSGFAVHLIDLDRFKDVNDTLGHGAGDVLLRLVAGRVRSSMRKNDFVARLGGDEFAVIQSDVNDEWEAVLAAQRWITILDAPFQIQGQSVVVGASIGIVTVPYDGATSDDVIKKADIALYRAKDDGRGTAVMFRPEFESSLRSRHQLGVDLRHAVRDGQLQIYYQPIISLESSCAKTCEALMRWEHPIRGWISPGEFIPVAEDLGLIGLLGEWALRQACCDASTWPDGVKVAVNLSAAQFSTTDIVGITRSALEDAQLAPERLELEVTESLLLRDEPETCSALHQLRALGVSVALDDFGTGYASLSYLLAFPFDKIKIDRMFVRDIVESDQSAAIVRAIAHLADSLGIKTVAEGVETVAQLDFVSALGCDAVQGFLFSKPVPACQICETVSRPFGPQRMSA